MRPGLATAAAVVLVVLSAVPAAAAETPGTLLVIPARGTIDSPVDVVTSGLCTRGVTFVVAVRGEGIDPVTSGNAVGNTELRVLEPAPYPGHHAVPLSRTLREYFTINGIGAARGNYDLVFACRDRLDSADLQTFAATIRIDKSGAYQALGPAASPLEDFLATAESAAPGDEPADAGEPTSAQPDSSPTTAESAARGDSAGPTPPEAAAADAPGQEASSQQLPSPDMTQTAASSSMAAEENTWRYALIAVGAMLLGGAVYLAWKARTR